MGHIRCDDLLFDGGQTGFSLMDQGTIGIQHKLFRSGQLPFIDKTLSLSSGGWERGRALGLASRGRGLG